MYLLVHSNPITTVRRTQKIPRYLRGFYMWVITTLILGYPKPYKHYKPYKPYKPYKHYKPYKP